MQAVYGDQYVNANTVRSWVKQFQDGEVGQTDEQSTSANKIQNSDLDWEGQVDCFFGILNVIFLQTFLKKGTTINSELLH
uniref:Mos1 transposase HTH domain-containing protein n=1 Tax=Arion vulgaris TaxID=1028688 RepID=A0A0B7AYQ2_9EUPU